MTQEHRVNIGFRYFQDVFTSIAFGLVKTSGLLIQFKIFDNCKDVISAQDNLTLVCNSLTLHCLKGQSFGLVVSLVLM